MDVLLRHLPVLPIVLPLVTGAVLLLLAETRRVPRLVLTLSSVLAQLAAAITMVWLTTDSVTTRRGMTGTDHVDGQERDS